ncbi:hypothetical protein FRC01_011385, partial [Tulasnella sp. 417]
MLARVKDNIRKLVARKVPELAQAKKSTPQVCPSRTTVDVLPPQVRPSRTTIDALPLEVLIEVFKAVVDSSFDQAYRVIESLSLVCRFWRDAGRGMELLKTSVSSPESIDGLLSHIYARASQRPNIHTLSVVADKHKDFYRLPELLTCCKTSLRELQLYRGQFDAREVELLQDTKVEDRPEYNLPNLTSLSLSMLTPRELTSLLTIAHPQKLAYLELSDTFLDHNHALTEELTSLRLPSLKEILIAGRFTQENPVLTWLFQIAPNLETLEVSIARNFVPPLTVLLASEHILNNFQQIRLYIKSGNYGDLDPNNPDLVALIRVVKERGWRHWVWMGVLAEE